jgi:hypothetical protein
VVDLGCGTGRTLPCSGAWSAPSGRVIGVDLTDAMMEQARQRAARADWTNVDLVDADAAGYHYPVPPQGICPDGRGRSPAQDPPAHGRLQATPRTHGTSRLPVPGAVLAPPVRGNRRIHFTMEVRVIRKSGIGWAVAMLALVGTPAGAQQHQHAGAMAEAGQDRPGSCMMMQGMMDMMGMSEAMAFRPAHVLTHREALSLSADQVARIEALDRGMMPEQGMAARSNAATPMAGGMEARMTPLREAFRKTPADPAAIRSAVEGMAAMHARMMSHQLTAAASVRDLLSPEQRDKALAQPAGCMAGGMKPGGPPPAGPGH